MYQPNKHPASPPPLVEGCSNKTKASSGVQSWQLYRSSTRLPVSKLAPVALWGGFRFGTGWYPRLERFLEHDERPEHHFQERYK